MKTAIHVYVKEDFVGTFYIEENAIESWQNFKKACSLNPVIVEAPSLDGYLFHLVVDGQVEGEILLGEESLPFIAAFQSEPTFEIIEIKDNV
jgi:hypothetical protein